jgi:integrase
VLNDAKIKNAKPRAKPFKLFDELGLYLIVNPNGSKGWRFKYRFGGREKLLSFGSYEDVSLRRAREKRRDARELLDRKIDPSSARKEERRTARAALADVDRFEYVAIEYFLVQAGKPPTDPPPPLADLKTRLDERLEKLADENRAGASRVSTLGKMRRRLERYVVPHLGDRPVASITGPELLAVIRRVEGHGKLETARRTLSAAGRVFRYAVNVGRAPFDPAASIDRGVLVPVETRGFAAITDPKRIGELMRAIHGYQGEPATMAALKLAPLLFVRPGELRAAEWTEFYLDGKEPEWRIPAERMKARQPHVVPLPKQAVEIVEDLRRFTGEGRFLFPSLRSRDRYMSDNTLNAALRRLGFTSDEMTAHGFRKLASTRLNELGFSGDAIERQLAHVESNTIRAVYNYAEYLPQRRKMMQSWADYLEGLRTGAKVTAIGRRMGRSRA